MTDKNVCNFIIKFYEEECSIKIEILHISDYFNHLRIMTDILGVYKLFDTSMNVTIKYGDKENIINNANDLFEFLYSIELYKNSNKSLALFIIFSLSPYFIVTFIEVSNNLYTPKISVIILKWLK